MNLVSLKDKSLFFEACMRHTIALNIAHLSPSDFFADTER